MEELITRITRVPILAATAFCLLVAGLLAAPGPSLAANHGDLTPGPCIEDPDVGPDSCSTLFTEMALTGVRTLTVTPDEWLYTASEIDDAISITTAGTGFLVPGACWADNDTGDPTCDNIVNGLEVATSVAVSPDGESLYAAAFGDDAVVSFDRTPGTGTLTTLSCIDDNDPGQGPDVCPQSTDGLDGANSVAVSPDGKSVYVASRGDNAVVRFDRNMTTGVLTPQDCWDDNDNGADSCGHITNGLSGALALTVSPDNKSVYVASGLTGGDDAVVHLHRDTGTGELTAAECYDDNDSGADTCPLAGETNGLGGVRSIAVSPNGTSLYTAASADDAVARFSRAADGTLTPQGCIDDHDAGQGPDDCGGGNTVPALQGAHSLALSGDGRSLYVSSFQDDAVVAFDRNATSGILTFIECVDDNDSGADLCTKTAGGLDGAAAIGVNPLGTRVFASGFLDASVLVLVRTDLEAPETTITAGPAEGSSIADPTPTFAFGSTEPGTFTCRIDGEQFAACDAAFTVAVLSLGPHELDVFATDPSDNADPTPATRSFNVLDTTAPDTAINGRTKYKTRKKKARVSFTFTSTEAGASFQCSVDGAPFGPCASPLAFKARRGAHSLKVRSSDASGNQDDSPASLSFRVKKKKTKRRRAS